MARIRTTIYLVAIVTLLLAVKYRVVAQPPAGDFWGYRGYCYAERFWEYPDINPEFGYCVSGVPPTYNLDCANYCSQIGNAGCAGICEDCGPPIPPQGYAVTWDEWTDPDCPNYHFVYQYYCAPCPNYTYHQYEPWGPNPYHHVILNALGLSVWFLANEDNWPHYIHLIRNQQEFVPEWVTRGTFGWRQKIDETYHAFFIGSGVGPNALYWAHTNDRHEEPLDGYFSSAETLRILFRAQEQSPHTSIGGENE